MRIPRIEILLLFVLLGSDTVFAQTIDFDQRAEAAFALAVKRFEQHDYRRAAQFFGELIAGARFHQRTTASYMMAARSSFLVSDYQRCIVLCREFLKRFPHSLYARTAHEFLADALRRTGDDYVALTEYIRAYTLCDNSDERQVYIDNIAAICQSGLRFQTLRNALEAFRDEDISTIVLMQWIDFAYQSGEQEAAIEAFHSLPPVSRSAVLTEHRKQLAMKLGIPLDAVTLGLMLPSPTDMTMAGDVLAFRDGVLTALNEYRDSGGIEVEIDVAYAPTTDSLQSAVTAMAANPRMIGILGGVFSDDAAALAKAGARTDIPCLISALVADSLPAGPKTVFQLGTTARTRGELTARYLTRAFATWSIAVLAPLESDSREIAQGFIEEAKRLNHPPSVVSWYSLHAQDLRVQFKTISEKLRGHDSLSILFAPISDASAIHRVLAGYQAGGLRSQIVGAGEWDHPDMFPGDKLPQRPVLFESDYYIALKDSAYRHFEYAFLVQSKRLASRKAVLGYDAAKFFLSSLSSGSLQRESVAARLRRVYFGLRGPIAFPGRQTNQGTTIYRYEDQTVIKHTTIPEK